MVKVYVELVWDIHFPGKLTREGKPKRKKAVRIQTKLHETTQQNYFHKEEENRP